MMSVWTPPSKIQQVIEDRAGSNSPSPLLLVFAFGTQQLGCSVVGCLVCLLRCCLLQYLALFCIGDGGNADGMIRAPLCKVIGGDTECPLQVCQLSRSSESTHFLCLRRDVALFDPTRAPDSF